MGLIEIERLRWGDGRFDLQSFNQHHGWSLLEKTKSEYLRQMQ